MYFTIFKTRFIPLVNNCLYSIKIDDTMYKYVPYVNKYYYYYDFCLYWRRSKLIDL